jgi:hypothetical protein
LNKAIILTRDIFLIVKRIVEVGLWLIGRKLIMGATNEIKGTNISLQLEGKECPQCQQKFTEQEIDNRNYDIWFDTTNDVKLIPMSEVKNDSYYFPTGRTGYELTI